VVDVDGKPRVGLRIVEGLAEQDLVDSLHGRLSPSRARKIFRERLTHEASKRHPARPRRIGGAPMKLARE